MASKVKQARSAAQHVVCVSHAQSGEAANLVGHPAVNSRMPSGLINHPGGGPKAGPAFAGAFLAQTRAAPLGSSTVLRERLTPTAAPPSPNLDRLEK